MCVCVCVYVCVFMCSCAKIPQLLHPKQKEDNKTPGSPQVPSSCSSSLPSQDVVPSQQRRGLQTDLLSILRSTGHVLLLDQTGMEHGDRGPQMSSSAGCPEHKQGVGRQGHVSPDNPLCAQHVAPFPENHCWESLSPLSNFPRTMVG